MKRRASNDQAEAKHSKRRTMVEPVWSMDPALALSSYDNQHSGDEEMEEQHGDLADTDCTWVSHSMLQRGGEKSPDTRGTKSGEYSVQFIRDVTSPFNNSSA